MIMKHKFLQYFIGAADNRDEYQLREIYKTLAFSGIFLWYLTLLLMFISLIIDTVHNTLNFSTIALFVLTMVYAINVVLKLRKERLDDTDCASLDEYKVKKRHIKKKSIFTGVLWGVFMLVMMQYIFPYLSDGSIDINWWSVLIWCLAGLAFGTIIYWNSVSKLQKYF
jgi:predicted membrane protein